MKKSKLKAKIAQLEAEKAQLRKDIYLLIDEPESSNTFWLKTAYKWKRTYLNQKYQVLMYGSINFDKARSKRRENVGMFLEDKINNDE
jgi:hypothetical protein